MFPYLNKSLTFFCNGNIYNELYFRTILQDLKNLLNLTYFLHAFNLEIVKNYNYDIK